MIQLPKNLTDGMTQEEAEKLERMVNHSLDTYGNAFVEFTYDPVTRIRTASVIDPNRIHKDGKRMA